MHQRVPLGWAGIDVGKGHHWICLIDENGAIVSSAKVVNDEAAILDAIGGVLAAADEVVWGESTSPAPCRASSWRCWPRTGSG